MSVPKNKILYEQVKREAKKKFARWPSAYGSAWLVKEYKKRGGEYHETSKNSAPTKSPMKSYHTLSPKTYSRTRHRSRFSKSPPKKYAKGVDRWMQEEWIQVVPYLKNGVKIACGDRKNESKACRPFKRISKDTPITIPELIDLHGKKKVLELANMKIKDMDGRLYWKRGTFNKN